MREQKLNVSPTDCMKRDNKQFYISLDPDSQDKLDHLQQIFKFITGKPSVSNSIIFRLALDALVQFYDEMIEGRYLLQQSLKDEKRKILDAAKGSDLCGGLIEIPDNHDLEHPLQTYQEKLLATLKIRQLENRQKIDEMLTKKETIEEYLQDGSF